MTLQIESAHVYTQHGVAVSVHGVAQVRQVQHTCTMNTWTFLFIVLHMQTLVLSSRL